MVRMNLSEAEIAWSSGSGDIGVIEVATYPSGDPLIKWDNARQLTRVLLRPRSMLSFMAAMFWMDALAWRGYLMPELILPCTPGARQDRMNSSGDYLFTAKSIAKELNVRSFPRVTVLDPHSDVTAAVIDRCRVIKSADYFEARSEEYVAVVAPDGGAEKRATAVATLLGVPLLHGWKKREVGTGSLSGFGLQQISSDLATGRLLIVDDICDGGGTFIGLVGEMAGRDVDLFVSHGYFSKGIDPLLAYFGKVICTDSVVGTDAVIDVDSPERESARLLSRIRRSREGRVQIIPICERLLSATEGAI